MGRAVSITFVLPDGMGLGGVMTWSVEMARQLAAAGQPVHLLEHVNPTVNCELQAPPDVHLVRHRGRPPVFAYTRDVHQYLPAYREVLPGLIIPNYAFGTYGACAAIARQQSSRLRVIGFAHADQAYYYNLLGYYEPLVHLFVAVSQEVAETLEERMPHRRDDIRVRPCGVGVADSLNRTYSPPHEPIRLVYAGRLVEYQKRVSDLVYLAEWLGRQGGNFELRIIGDGIEGENLLGSVQRLDPPTRARVRLEGRVPYDRMPEVWRSADVCVLVSEYEGTSISMLEAMAHGCVPVVTRVSGTSAAITPGESGYLVDVGDMAHMARIVQRLAADRGKLAQVGLAAHRTVRDGFSFPAYVDWFRSMADEVWKLPPRAWPAGRRLLPPGKMLYYGWMKMSVPIQRASHLGARILRRARSLAGRRERAASAG
jgi:glycosyltransferase involved in cell wall biosynthesis